MALVDPRHPVVERDTSSSRAKRTRRVKERKIDEGRDGQKWFAGHCPSNLAVELKLSSPLSVQGL